MKIDPEIFLREEAETKPQINEVHILNSETNEGFSEICKES